MGTIHKTKANIFEKLQFLAGTSLDSTDEMEEVSINMDDDQLRNETVIGTVVGSEHVITDNQEYYEVSIYPLTAMHCNG